MFFLIFQNLNQSVAHDWTSGLQKLILKKEDEIRAADRCRIQLQLPGKQDKSVEILITKLSKLVYVLGLCTLCTSEDLGISSSSLPSISMVSPWLLLLCHSAGSFNVPEQHCSFSPVRQSNILDARSKRGTWQ